jgi:ferric-dicitrate binding protein FerR (iron transport regulator)
MDQSSISDLQHGYRIAYLVAQHLKGALTEAERAELDNWLSQSASNRRLFTELTDPKYLEAQALKHDDIDAGSYLGKFKAEVIKKDKRRALRIWVGAAAAAVFSVLLITAIRTFERDDVKDNVMASTKLTRPAPEWKSWRKAVLTIAGREIPLGQNGRDTILADGLIVKSGSTLVYTSATTLTGQHVISIPDKGTYTVQLPDGTVATLNANAVLSYSIPFDEHERRVELKGEGYFQVAKEVSRPFRVATKTSTLASMTVEAIGTAFNVFAPYSGRQISITLIEGKVNVSSERHSSIILHPDEMAYLGTNGFEKKAVDVSAAIAWTRHDFIFNQTPLSDVLEQLSLWYGTRFQNENVPDEYINGTFSRDKPVEEILRKLAVTGTFRYRNDGQHITIY